MSRGVVISLLVVIGIGGLIYALTRSAESSGQRELQRISGTLAQSERGIAECDRLVRKLDGRFAASASVGLHDNVMALRRQLEGLVGRHQELSADPSDSTEARQARRRLSEDAEQFAAHVEEHRAYLQRLNDAVQLLAEAQAPAEKLIVDVREALRERKEVMEPGSYARLVTRLRSWRQKAQRANDLGEDGLKNLYAEPGSETGWTEVRTAANEYQSLEAPLRELLEQIREE